MSDDAAPAQALAQTTDRKPAARRSAPHAATFVQRSTYRQRRIRDASRLLPFLGFLVLLIPSFLSVGRGVVGDLVFVFVIWGLLVLAALFCAHELRPDPERKPFDPKS